jgi:hypothetical protein
MAIHHKKPFVEKGRNFQDAVICLATVDDLAASSETVGAFVSRDDIFEQKMLDNLCGPHGLTLKLFKGEEALNDDMRSFLREQTVQKWIEDEDNAKAAVLENLPTLQSFISANLEVPTRMGFLASNRILLVKQIDIVSVPRVETPYPLDRTPGEPVVITAKMELDIHVKLRRWSSAASTPESLKAGQIPGPADASARRALLTEEKEETLRRAVSVEIRCVLRGGRYVDLEPMSVAFISSASVEPSTMPPAFGELAARSWGLVSRQITESSTT